MSSTTGTRVRPEELYEGMLLTLSEERAAEDMLHAAAGRQGRPTRVSTPFRHRDVHDSYELAVVTEGSARVATPTEVFELAPGKLLLIEPGVEHDESPGDPPGQYVGFWCHIQDTMARLYRTRYSPPKTWRSGPALEAGGRTGLESIVRAVTHELESQEWNWLDSSHALLVYLTSILIRRLRRGASLRLRASESPTISADARTWRVIQAALRYCDANFRRPLRLADVASAVGYSPSHLSRLISTHLGHSLSDHVRNLRMTAGKHLLETTDLAIGEIAHSLGYSDPAYFSHAFSRATGLSPRAYRRRMGLP
jgi:AraC-like DNA-binding protein/mannose-6-phosphate isomerase-like protein (cupin superfamily)